MGNKKTIILNNGQVLISINSIIDKVELNSNCRIIEFKPEKPAVCKDLSKDDIEAIFRIIDIERLKKYIKARNFFRYAGNPIDIKVKETILHALDNNQTIILNDGQIIITVCDQEQVELNSENRIIEFKMEDDENSNNLITGAINPFAADCKNLSEEDCQAILKIVDLEGLQNYLKTKAFFLDNVIK